ncbi:hypothetical protein DV737_g1973, partial [Chaetothyriales sp. CBS 132003]
MTVSIRSRLRPVDQDCSSRLRVKKDRAPVTGDSGQLGVDVTQLYRQGGSPVHERGQGSRRAPRLPSLTTNLPLRPPRPPGSGAHQQLLTPLSTVSLSSPFTAAQPCPYSPLSTGLSREPSPMAVRMPSYNVPYNPSEWASGSRRPSTAVDSEQQLDPDGTHTGALVASPADTLPSAGGLASTQTPPGLRSSLHARDAGVSINRALPPPPPPRLGVPDAARRSGALPKGRPVSVASLSAVFALDSQLRQEAQAQAQADLPGPPAAKRAASTGTTPPPRQLSAPASRDSSQSRSTSRSRGWQVGMPLPGPPPGPPPTTSRSSSTHTSREQARGASPAVSAQPQTRRVPLRAPMLSPMPPTPAGWTEDQPMRPAARHTHTAPLHIRTANLGPSIPSQDFFPATEPVGEPAGSSRAFGALTRSTAFRDSSVKGLRERRNIRKSFHGPDAGADLSALSVNTNPWADAMVSAASTNRSPTIFSEDSQPLDRQECSSATSPIVERPAGGSSVSDAKTSLVRPHALEHHALEHHALDHHALDPAPASSDSTPKSPVLLKMKGPATTTTSRAALQVQPPKTLPTPPLSQKAPESGRSLAPVSCLALPDAENESADKFSADSLQRHRDFLHKESQASTEEEKLVAFVDYIAVESVLRQQRYAATLLDGRLDLDATRKRIFNDADAAVQAFFQQRAGVDTPAPSVSSTFDDSRLRPESTWWSQYQPALSPIASMSNDEMSSRGRSSSRWWESQAGSQTDAPVNKVRRSKRESKYMGLSAALMQTSIDESDTPKNFQFDDAARPRGEYPDDKANPAGFGFYRDADAEPGPRPQSLVQQQPSPNLLDVSRFITLPPAYPRHYPAVNNAHPVLANYRLCVRSMSELSEIQARKSRHALSVQALRAQHSEKLAEGRTAFKNSIQVQIQDGTMTYAEAADAEEALRLEERRAEQAALKAEFDTLQDVVIGPLHDMLSDRLVQLSARIDELTEKLFIDSQQQNPDQPQQEGDDTPELLEYLTQLKWMFEAREQIHKEIFDLLTERNNKYKAIVLLPYRQANNVDKLRDTEAFFVRDNLDRAKTYGQESVNRHEQFFNIIEDNVARGVDLQSSAFWDLAPGLLDLLQQMPTDVAQLNNIAIPEQEYLENPSYFRYPQQYVYTLLDHAEKSTYQFIESQINLHCLLHEAKTSVLLARCRMMEANEQAKTPPSPSATKISDYRAREEATLTTELKQKVSIIEEQWLDAVGGQFAGARERIKAYLEAQGAWDDITRDD